MSGVLVKLPKVILINSLKIFISWFSKRYYLDLSSKTFMLAPSQKMANKWADKMENEAFTIWALFGRATITVKIVMIMLIGSSFWSWSIIFKKLISFRAARTEASNFDQSFWSGEPLDELLKNGARSNWTYRTCFCRWHG